MDALESAQYLYNGRAEKKGRLIGVDHFSPPRPEKILRHRALKDSQTFRRNE